jgi:selenocysteine lyase/cysteine desulfurase
MALDVDRYRSEFAVTEASVYLNHASVCAPPRRVCEAMCGAVEDVHRFGVEHRDRWLEAYETARSAAARLLNSEACEIAFTKNTSEAISFVANGLDWRAGDEVVSVESEFPANYHPWKVQERKGVRLILVPEEQGRVALESLVRALTPRTRVVAISFVQFLSGYRISLEQLGEICATRRILFFVDAIQGLGAFPVDVKQAKISALAADGHKWLLGPEGSGLFFLGKEWLDEIRPSTVGWMSVRGWNDFSCRDLTWREDARRFEYGTPSTVGIYGLGAALQLLLEVGVDAIAHRILNLTERLRQGLVDQGHRVYGPSEREECSGIVSFVPHARSAEDVVGFLQRQRVLVAARCGKVRVAPHFYNTQPEIDRVLELLGSYESLEVSLRRADRDAAPESPTRSRRRR